MPTLRLQSAQSFLNAASPENSLSRISSASISISSASIRQLKVFGLQRVEIELVVVEFIGVVRAFLIELRVTHLGFGAHAVAPLGFVKPDRP